MVTVPGVVVSVIREGVEVEGPAVAGSVVAVDELPLAPPTREPVPQATFSPLGWTEFVGGVVAPVEEAMVKRVVHCLSDAPGAVNW